MSLKEQRYCILLLVVTVFIVYFFSLRGSFQFDDYNVIVDEPTVHSLFAWVSNLPHSIRPLLKFTYTINWVSGLGVIGFHLFNLVVHSINATLIYLLSYRLANRFSAISLYGRKIALFTALLFAVHPVQTEAVTYISGRSSSLMAMFYLWSLLLYDHGARLKKRHYLYLISPALFALAVAVKETAITLPFALILWESVPNDTCKSWKEAAKRQAAHWAVFICLLVLIGLTRTYSYFFSYSADIRTIEVNLLSQINGIFYLISRIILINRLNIDPDLPVIYEWSLPLIGKFVFLLMVFAVGLLNFRKKPWLGFGVFWFFLQLLPTNSLIPRSDIANERHLYPAMWGFFLALSVEGDRLYELFNNKLLRRGSAVAGMLLLIVLGMYTIARNHIYRNEIALWEDTSRKSPLKARVYNNLGYAYFLSGKREDARTAYSMALKLNPDYEIARENLFFLDAEQRDAE